jgi:hypothetical protein
MPLPPRYTENISHFAMDGIFGCLQFASSDRRVRIDLCADRYDVDGFLRREHAVTSLSVADAKQAHWLLGRAIDIAESADDRQSCLWGDATHAVPVPPRYRSRAQPRGRPGGVASSPLSLSVYLTEVD